MNAREKAYDAVDATVFSSDMLHNPDERVIFVGYLARWNTALAESQEPSPAPVQPQAEPVAEIIECSKMGQQTVKEIEGRWKFLDYGTKLYAGAAPVAQAEPTETEKKAARYDWLRHGDNDELVLQRGHVAKDYVYLPRNEKLDDMIDAAMKGTP